MVKLTSADEGFIAMGPWGGPKGKPWAYKPDGRITEIIVRHGGVVDSIVFRSESCDGFTLPTSQKFGGPGGTGTDKVSIDGIEEYLTTISLTVGDYDRQDVIRSISFTTNLTEYGPFGSKTGTSVSLPMEDGFIFGFHGRAGKYLNAIGFYVAPKLTSFSQIGSHSSEPSHLMASSFMNPVVQRDAGPWGDQRGSPWDDGVFLAVKQVTLGLKSVHGSKSNVIEGIKLLYDQRDGSSYESQHGSFTPWTGSPSSGVEVHQKVVELDSMSGEIIVGVEGFYGSTKYTDGFEVITSISIYTNKKKYGPFGENKNGKHFSSMLSGGKVVGFFGRSGTCLNAIGLHTEYC